MLLSRQGGVGNFCFNPHMSSFPVFCILSIQLKSCLSIFKHSSLGRPFFLFLPSSIHDFAYLGISVSTGGMTIPHRIPLCIKKFSILTESTFSPSTLLETFSTNPTPFQPTLPITSPWSCHAPPREVRTHLPQHVLKFQYSIKALIFFFL